MERTTKSAGANCAVAALELTAAIQIKLVNDHTALHIGDADMESEDGLANSERPQEETCAPDCPRRLHQTRHQRANREGLSRVV